jgi:hypothetical protein
MRRILVVAAALALLIGSVPQVASAARVTRFSDTALQVTCFPLEAEDGTAVLLGQVSEFFGNDAVVGFWESGAEYGVDPPSLISREFELTDTGSALTVVGQHGVRDEPGHRRPAPGGHGPELPMDR